jgi:hypothetical protein
MTQLYNNAALVIGTTPITITVATGRARGRLFANITILNNTPGTDVVTIQYFSQRGIREDSISRNSSYFVRNVPVDDLQVSCDVSTAIAIDVSTETDLPATFQGLVSYGSTVPAYYAGALSNPGSPQLIATGALNWSAEIEGGFIAVSQGTYVQLFVGDNSPGQRNYSNFTTSGIATVWFGQSAGAPSGITPAAGQVYIPWNPNPKFYYNEKLQLQVGAGTTGTYSFRIIQRPV